MCRANLATTFAAKSSKATPQKLTGASSIFRRSIFRRSILQKYFFGQPDTVDKNLEKRINNLVLRSSNRSGVNR